MEVDDPEPLDDLARCPECDGKCFPLKNRRLMTTENCCMSCGTRFRIVKGQYQVQVFDESIRTFIWKAAKHPATR